MPYLGDTIEVSGALFVRFFKGTFGGLMANRAKRLSFRRLDSQSDVLCGQNFISGYSATAPSLADDDLLWR